MKTYSETQGHEPFDWRKALENPPEIDTPEHDELISLSEKWVTCACGNLCDAIPRDEDGTPNDLILKNLGVNFDHCVENCEWEIAKEILKLIEKRSSEILKEMGL